MRGPSRDLKASLAPRVPKDLLVPLELREPLALQDPPELLVLREPKDPLVPSVPQVRMALRAPLEPLEPRGLSDPLAHREPLVQLALQVLPARLDLKGLLVLPVLLALLALRDPLLTLSPECGQATLAKQAELQ
jgi:hypothetical protein